MKKTGTKILIAVIVVLITVGAVYWTMRSISFFDISDIQIISHGQVTKTTSEVSRIIQPLKGQNIFEVNTSALKAKILETSGVSAVEIKRYYPSTVQIEIEYTKYLAKIECSGKFYLADDQKLTQITNDVYAAYTDVNSVEIDSDYCRFLSEWGYDEGFFKLVQMLSNVSSSLISSIKYDNNNGNDFGRLILELKALGVQLYVCEPVTSQRIEEAIEILKSQISVPENNSRYDLFSGSLINRS